MQAASKIVTKTSSMNSNPTQMQPSPVKLASKPQLMSKNVRR